MMLSAPLRRSLIAIVAAASLAACGDGGTEPGGNPPATPAGLAAAVQPDNSVQVSWNAVSGATSYTLQRADGSAPGAFAAVGGSLTTTSYADATTAAGQTYSYRVAAVNAEGASAFSSPVQAAVAGARVATLSGIMTQSRTLYSDTLYTLSGYVKVANGATLTIQAGTRIVGDFTTKGSSLWILRGSKIEAHGTAAAPIVFTSSQPAGQRKPGDWGGLIIIGNGVSNRSGTIYSEGPQGVTEVYSGGTDFNDNSGTLRYVRIEFAGYDVTGTGQELNALSSYAVGRGTTYEYIQTLAGLDDSFEWFGGAVDGRYLISYEAGDDHFDWSEGYRGRNQYLIAFQSTRLSPAPGTGGISSDPEGFEGDGCPTGEAGCDAGNDQQPYSMPVFANFTVIGPGAAVTQSASGDYGAVIRRGTGGYFTNGILARWSRQGLTIRDAVTNSQLTSNDSLNIVNLLLAKNGTNYDDDAGANFGKASVFATDNHVVTAATTASLFASMAAPNFDWTPAAGSPAASITGAIAIPAGYTGSFFGGTLTPGAYFGAADPAGAKWWDGWTSYAQQ
jgi:hypothetical protein